MRRYVLNKVYVEFSVKQVRSQFSFFRAQSQGKIWESYQGLKHVESGSAQIEPKAIELMWIKLMCFSED